jgi:hypothetical protein
MNAIANKPTPDAEAAPGKLRTSVLDYKATCFAEWQWRRKKHYRKDGTGFFKKEKHYTGRVIHSHLRVRLQVLSLEVLPRLFAGCALLDRSHNWWGVGSISRINPNLPELEILSYQHEFVHDILAKVDIADFSEMIIVGTRSFCEGGTNGA